MGDQPIPHSSEPLQGAGGINDKWYTFWKQLRTRTATSDDQETGTADDGLVTSALQHRHKSAAKGWALADFGAGAQASYNVSSVTDGGVGLVTVNWGTDFSSSNFADPTQVTHSALRLLFITGRTTGSSSVSVRDSAFNLADGTTIVISAFGDQ